MLGSCKANVSSRTSVSRFIFSSKVSNACSKQCIFVYKPPGGDSHMKGAGMLIGNFELNPNGDQHGHEPTFFLPLKETILLQCSLGIDVIKNFDYMNGVNKMN